MPPADAAALEQGGRAPRSRACIDPEIRKPDHRARHGRVGVGGRRRARRTVGIRLTIVGCPAADRIERDVRQAAETVAGPGNADVDPRR